MQDDVYMLAQDGWKTANVIRQLVPVKDKSGKFVYKEEHDFEFGTKKRSVIKATSFLRHS